MACPYIDHHYAAPLTIRQISREVALSPFYFIRLFRRVCGQTPHQYLTQRRIEKAKELLCTSDLCITEICMAVGFESVGSFSALFRKLAGISPTAYREHAVRSVTFPYIPLCVCYQHGLEEMTPR